MADDQAFFQDHPDAALIVDPVTRILLLTNRAAQSAYGYTADTLSAMRLDDVDETASELLLDGSQGLLFRTHRRNGGEQFKVLVRQRQIKHDAREAILLIVQDARLLEASLAGLGEGIEPGPASRQEEEANLRIASELLKFGFWKYDIPNRKLVWSPSVYQMAGIEPHEFDGTPEGYIKILYPDDRDQAELAVRALDNPDINIYEFERRLTRKDGRVVYIKGVGERTRTSSGDVITGVVQDVTADRQRQGQLRLLGASIERLNDIVVILRVDPSVPGTDSPIVYINSAFERITGYAQKDMLGRPLSFIMSFVEPKFDPREIEATLNTGQSLRVELVGPVRTDKWITWDVELLPVADAHGKYTHWIAVARDITERRLAEQRAAFNEDRFQLVSRSTADVVWEWDVQADTLLWSEAFDKLTGVPGAHLETRFDAWSRRIHPDDRVRVVGTLRGTVVSPFSQSWSEEYRFCREDGGERAILDRGFVVRDDTGRAARMVGTMIDLTERRASEQRSRESERLEAIGQLTGGVAHDFNNLLTVILGNSDVLRDRLDDPVLRRMAELIHLAATRGSDLTRRLLAFARRQPLKPQRVCLNERTGSVHALLRGALDARIRVRHMPAKDLWAAHVDPGQFDVAILNLAFNARDAMPEGGTLIIATENLRVRGRSGMEREGVPSGDYVCVTISDTGTGMAEEAQRRAFEPFFTTKPAGKGSGLGLSMVYGFVRQSEGHVLIRSLPGEGTSVRLFFPRSTKGVVAVAAPALVATKGEATQAGSVLIVEDDPLVREHAAHNFEALGYTVILTASADEALTALEGHPETYLLFTDVILGAGMNGIELAAEARKRRPDLNVLYTSGYVPGDHGFTSPLEPGAEMLRKPYERNELVRKLGRIFKRLPSST
ncbi:sensory box sensor histidine kinase/response regulator [Hyphomonas neptunium ATCC 15444]|uniref:histidine kinase n=1 Tax=Hyphomonas neptunium (strain ATCC 15444) TaxID=228405 RepID=Q0BXH4_HYPNA|nr:MULTISPECIES: PAS domain S-box protein [Hyphomonas]ABI76877.1 sensory box sensor histidine kinase/response regulator [Hyphomonas neptunium ATCC 15444]